MAQVRSSNIGLIRNESIIMKNLIITPTYSCPFKCKFCFNLDKCDDKTLLDLNDLEEFLKKYSKQFDKVIISGGETSLLASSYMNNLIKIVNKNN